MPLQDAVKPISYVKAHAAELLREVAENRQIVIITQNGEAKAVLQDIGEYERIQESLALLKILALSRKDLEAGRVRTAAKAFGRIRDKIRRRRRS
ncbi:MAG: type II toxin-antitoxin system Phd/YefM family antitoxin [Deltaproteobacteria bacterium]|nr:type II toxin-antitoxin system Phd/YefM family antitoxin [Deltaproteobacteria bacterium]PWB67367.1 MAG: prevent-host-death protein [Deltaproteobacteria bacterium]